MTTTAVTTNQREASPRDDAGNDAHRAAHEADAELAEVDALMREAVRGPAARQAPGLLATIAAEALRVPGKRVRARLALDAARALDAPAFDARVWAAALELVHNASLVHDDLQDGDQVRRGVATTWVTHGAAQAINAGDLLLTVPYRLLGRAAPAARWPLVEALARAVEEMARGQAEEPALAPAPGDRSAYEQWARVARGKTGALLAAPIEGAALLAGRDAGAAREMAAPFVRVGELFQIVDDVIDAFGDKGRGVTGCDLDEGKVSSLVAVHLTIHPDDGPWLARVLREPRGATPRADIERAIARFDDGGALDAVLLRAARLAERIRREASLHGEPRLARIAWSLVDRVVAPLDHIVRAGARARGGRHG